MRTIRLSSAIAAAVMTTLFALPAQTAIRCSGGYQHNAGGDVATPFCEQQYLAEVARGYGARVSGAQLSNSMSLELETCRLVGNDIRVSHICERYLPQHNNNRCIFPPC